MNDISLVEPKPVSAYGITTGKLLKSKKLKICVAEATTGGLISASLLAQPGASRFFISSCVLYSKDGIQQFLPDDVIEKSSVMDVAFNYKNKENYIASKETFVKTISEYLRELHDCDYCLCESGTSGPTFYIPGVTSGFTAIGIASRDKTYMDVLQTEVADRESNMYKFLERSLEVFNEVIIEEHGQL
ncbi:MAG: CinA family protein [Pseudomonadales bacterium]|nr:CinA family protein [Pseudomonadales bacterium]